MLGLIFSRLGSKAVRNSDSIVCHRSSLDPCDFNGSLKPQSCHLFVKIFNAIKNSLPSSQLLKLSLPPLYSCKVQQPLYLSWYLTGTLSRAAACNLIYHDAFRCYGLLGFYFILAWNLASPQKHCQPTKEFSQLASI